MVSGGPGRNRRAIGVFLVLFALISFGISWLSAREMLQLRRSGLSAPGVVVEIVGHRDSKGTILYRAVVAFRGEDGSALRFSDRVSSTPAAYDVGDAVLVRYLPADPARSAIIDRGAWNLAPSWALLGLGVVLLLFGIPRAIFA